MKYLYAIILLVTVLHTSTCAQQLVWDYSQYGICSNTSEPLDMCVDKDSNVYICGYYKGMYTVGSYSFVSQGLEDAFVVKYDKYKNIVAAKSFGGDSLDMASGLGIDSIGNIYINGMYSSKMYLGNDSLQSHGSTDIFIIKLNSQLNTIWLKSIFSTDGDGFNWLKNFKLKNNNIYVYGEFGETILGPPYSSIGFFDNIQVSSTGKSDAFIAKYNLDGIVSWVKTIKGADGETIQNIEIDQNENIRNWVL